MNIQLIVVMGVGLFLAMWTGIAVGNGEYGKAGFVAGGTLLAVLMAVIGRRYRFEGWFIGIIVACYFLGGKGFSYQRLVSILFVGEATLILLVVFHVFRVMTGAARLIPKHRLTIPLLIFLVYGFIHLLIDLREFPLILVLKDTATVYYALFFVLVYGPVKHKPTRDYILKLLPLIAAAAMLLFTITMFIPGIRQAIMSAPMMRGAPIILQSIDSMVPVCIGFSGFAYFKSLQAQGLWKILYLLSSILCSAPLFTYGKAAFYLAFAAYLGALVVAGHWKILVTIIPIGIGSVLLLIVLVSSGIIKDENDKLKRFLDEFSSFNVVGAGSTGSQKHAQRTVDWRLTWWSMITEEVMDKRPLYGLGMGADISSEFHAKFNRVGHINMDARLARYPHNVVFTVLGRMGLIGLMIFIPILILITRELWIGFQVIRRLKSRCDPKYVFVWAFILGGFTNAFFQSTFEAPYTAIMFWTVLALLAVLNHDMLEEAKAAAARTDSDEDQSIDGFTLTGIGRPIARES